MNKYEIRKHTLAARMALLPFGSQPEKLSDYRKNFFPWKNTAGQM